MKQLFITAATGEVSFQEVEEPPLEHPQAVKVDTVVSAVSPGTERRIITAIRSGETKFDEDRPLGYASAGIVREVGAQAEGAAPGDLVAVYGSVAVLGGHLSVTVPRKHHFAKVPEGVTAVEAAFAAPACFPLNGLRLCRPQMGETFLVFGMGLLGLIGVQLAKAMGLVVVAVEPSEFRRAKAREVGADFVFAPDDDDLERAAGLYTEGAGADAALVCTAAESGAPVWQAMALLREKGRIALVGGGETVARRGPFHHKELELLAVKAAGPGRYDERYENDCIDYPIAYVRWTMHRNLKEVVRLMAAGVLRMEPLITDRLSIEEAPAGFERLVAGDEKLIGMVIEYDGSKE